MAIFMNGYFTLGDKGEINPNRFFKNSDELAKFVNKIINKYDAYTSVYYTVIFTGKLGILNK